MKRKVKKYAGGNLVDSSGNPVRSSSGEAVRTRFGKDEEDRPMSSGVEDYATMGKRASAVSPFSGPKEYISDSLKEDTGKESSKETESPKGIASGYKSGESKYERDDNEVSMPSERKKSSAVKPKLKIENPVKFATQSFGIKEEASPSSAKTRAGTSARTPDIETGSARTRAGTMIKGREEPSKEDVDKSMSSLADRIRKQDQENSFVFKPNKSPNRSYKSGGMTSSASSRADGIAQRGKTKGRIC